MPDEHTSPWAPSLEAALLHTEYDPAKANAILDALGLVDTDGDGIPDFRDKDSDNDGIPDWVERGPDGDAPRDFDGDGIPDYIDIDSDGDGVNDDVDPFINSNRGSTVVIDWCDSNVGNQDLGDGSTFNDRIGAIIARNHGDFLKQLNVLTNKWKKDGLISGKEKGKITSCVARSDLP